MTEKQENILKAALELFAEEGYSNTSTCRIANCAGVSEGLIFKHFGSKKGLLEAVFNMGLEHIEQFVEKLNEIDDPKKIIETAFNFPFSLVNNNKVFWQLQFSLQYQSPETAKKYSDNNLSLMVTLPSLLEDAFDELGYENPEMEARLLMIIIGGLCTSIVQGKDHCDDQFCQFIKQKYDI